MVSSTPFNQDLVIDESFSTCIPLLSPQDLRYRPSIRCQQGVYAPIPLL